MQFINASKMAIVVGLLFALHSDAATLAPRTLSAWEEYVRQSKAEILRHPCDPSHFLSVSQQSRQNPTTPSAQGRMVVIPSGLIHHWIGTAFIPNVRTFDLLAVLQDYDSYAELYKPAVVRSKLLNHTPGEFNYRLKFMQKGFGVKAGLIGEFRTTYSRLDSGTGYSVTESTQLVELQSPESSDEQALSSDASRGYVEKVFTVVKYRELSSGVFVELESLTLSRGVPSSVRWLIAPIVQRFSRQVMTDTLQRLSDKVQASQAFESASTK